MKREIDRLEASAPTRRQQLIRGGLLLTAVVAISVMHYLTPPVHAHWHLVYQRLYYLPILFGAFWFGLAGGVLTALVTSVLYLPHIMLHWGHDPLYRSNQMTEIVMFLVIAAVAGALIDRIRREREEHRRTAEELAGTLEQLQQTFERLRLVDRLSALGTLSAGMAHEIKNPLGSITGSIEILEQAVPANDERREFVEILRKEIQRLSRIVNDHLDLVRHRTPQRGPEDLGQIARSVAELMAKQAEQQGVRLGVEVEAGLPTLQIDGQQLRQAVLNLVINGIQALPEGGEVTLRVERAGERVHVIVEDDGAGLDSETQRRGFEPFYTTKEGGTGLGLSIAFQIADAHGGDLRAQNRPEGGASFCLEVPIEQDDARPTAEEDPR